jgi:hypothetical protein
VYGVFLLIDEIRYWKNREGFIKESVWLTEGINIYRKLVKEDPTNIEYISLAEKEGIEIEVQSVMGEPAIQIVKKAEEGNYQIIVMGSRGLGNLKGLMLGSVSQKVLNYRTVLF